MAAEKGWAKKLPTKTIKEIIGVGDGHTLFEASTYLEVGLPQEVVDQIKSIHKSKKTCNHRALEVAQGVAREYAETCYAEGDTLKTMLDNFSIEDMIEGVFSSLIEQGFEEISSWDPKLSIWKDGKVVEEMEAVYGLDVIHALARDLDVSFEPKMGRGFQYNSIANAIHSWIEAGRGEGGKVIQLVSEEGG